jgi:D-alanine transaminase
MKELGFFDGQFIELNQTAIALEDRGYQFGDGIYEATRIYNGKCFALERHLARCRRSLRELQIPITYMDEELTAIHNDIIKKSGIHDGSIYFQITRGIAPRAHYFPDKVRPLLAMTIRASKPNNAWQENGIHAALVEDLRWLRCDIKSLNLLGNVLAKQAAHAKGLTEAVQYRRYDNTITEGASSNFFIIKDGLIWTHPLDHLILKGVTRSILAEKCLPELGLALVEKGFTPEFAFAADEAFVTSTSLEVTPVVAIDAHTIGTGRPGPITRKLMTAYHGIVQQACPANV